MANCHYCGVEAGFGFGHHKECFELFRDGASLQEIKDLRKGVPLAQLTAPVAVALPAGTIAVGVLAGMWLFAVTAGIVGALIYMFRPL